MDIKIVAVPLIYYLENRALSQGDEREGGEEGGGRNCLIQKEKEK